MSAFVPYESPEQYFASVEAARAATAASATSATHCFLLADAARALIEERRLLYAHEGDDLFLLEDLNTYERLSFIVSDVEGVRPLAGLSPATKIERPYRRDRPKMSEAEAAVIERLGFQLGRNEGRMTLRVSDIPMPTSASDRRRDVRRARFDERRLVAALLAKTFKAVYAQLPTDEKLDGLIADGSVDVAVHDGRVVGALVSEQEGKTRWIRQVAVDANARGAGFGGALVDAFIRKRAQDVATLRLWVDRANDRAIALYKSRGFRFDGREAQIFVSPSALAERVQ